MCLMEKMLVSGKPCSGSVTVLLLSVNSMLMNQVKSYGASLVAQTVKNLPALQETQVRSLDQEDPLEKAVATHSSILAWRIPRIEEPGGPQSMGSQRVRHD